MALAGLLIISLICTGVAWASRRRNRPSTQEVFYDSGSLRIQAYLYKPEGDGPFPVVIYNHGTRDGRERVSSPFRMSAKMLMRAGYAVLVPERRGYGKSDGAMWRQEVGGDPSRLIPRLQAETDDVLRASTIARACRTSIRNASAVMGWSFGGVVSMLAASPQHGVSCRGGSGRRGPDMGWQQPYAKRTCCGRGEIRHTDAVHVAETTAPPRPYHARGNIQEAQCSAQAGDLRVFHTFAGSRAAPGHALFSMRAPACGKAM